MAKVGEVSDDVLKTVIIVGALGFAYTLYVARTPLQYGASKVDDTQDWLSSGWKKFWGAPKWAWDETLGQGGIRLTGNEPVSADARGFWKKDEGSWLWGWGPAK